MKTKYILHGGNAQDVNEDNDLFFSEILKDFSGEVNVLLVQFAAIEEKQERYKQRHIVQFDRAKLGKKINYKVASVDEFVGQIEWADVVYLCGSPGGTPRLLKELNKFENLIPLFKGKTVAGESAGANCLASYCFSKSGGILQTLGCVPVRIIPHYETGMEKMLNNFHEELELLLLPSYKFRVFEIDI